MTKNFTIVNNKWILCECRQVDAICFDFAKAFDVVDNDVLLREFSARAENFTPKP